MRSLRTLCRPTSLLDLHLRRTRFALVRRTAVSATQQVPEKRKVMVEMAEHEYQTLRSTAKHNERTMSARIRYLIKRELVAK
jgi:hypothetical protein